MSTPKGALPESLAIALSNASAGAIALAWNQREESQYDVKYELDDYVGSLRSIAHLQRWFNASQLGLTDKLTLQEASVSCRQYSDAMWNYLLLLHPNWRSVETNDPMWLGFSVDLVRYATDARCMDRLEALRLWAGQEPWNWEDAAPKATKLYAMEYLWNKGVRPLDAWVTTWYQTRTTDRIRDPAVLARWDTWNDWMATTVLPATVHFPKYTQLYHYVAKSTRLSMNWTRVPRLERLMPYLPSIHVAAAWHNDPCWLAVRKHDDPAWRDYVALYRLRHPKSFHHFAPDLANVELDAPSQDLWNIAHALHWAWPQVLEEIERADKKEGSLELPVDFTD